MRFNRSAALDKAADIGGGIAGLALCVLVVKGGQSLLEWAGLSEQVAFWVSLAAYSAAIIGLFLLLERRMQRRCD